MLDLNGMLFWVHPIRLFHHAVQIHHHVPGLVRHKRSPNITQKKQNNGCTGKSESIHNVIIEINTPIHNSQEHHFQHRAPAFQYNWSGTTHAIRINVFKQAASHICTASSSQLLAKQRPLTAFLIHSNR